MKVYKKMGNNAVVAFEILYFHMNMNLLAFHADSTYSNKNMNSKRQRKEINFSNRLRYAEQKNFFICTDVFEIYEGNDYDKIFEILSTLKNKKLKINKNLIENYKAMLENLDFELNYWSRTAEGIY